MTFTPISGGLNYPVYMKNSENLVTFIFYDFQSISTYAIITLHDYVCNS